MNDIVIDKRRVDTFRVHAYHGNGASDCQGELICVEISIDNFSGKENKYIHKCISCGEKITMDKQFPYTEYQEEIAYFYTNE